MKTSKKVLLLLTMIMSLLIIEGCSANSSNIEGVSSDSYKDGLELIEKFGSAEYRNELSEKVKNTLDTAFPGKVFNTPIRDLREELSKADYSKEVLNKIEKIASEKGKKDACLASELSALYSLVIDNAYAKAYKDSSSSGSYITSYFYMPDPVREVTSDLGLSNDNISDLDVVIPTATKAFKETTDLNDLKFLLYLKKDSLFSNLAKFYFNKSADNVEEEMIAAGLDVVDIELGISKDGYGTSRIFDILRCYGWYAKSDERMLKPEGKNLPNDLYVAYYDVLLANLGADTETYIVVFDIEKGTLVACDTKTRYDEFMKNQKGYKPQIDVFNAFFEAEFEDSMGVLGDNGTDFKDYATGLIE